MKDINKILTLTSILMILILVSSCFEDCNTILNREVGGIRIQGEVINKHKGSHGSRILVVKQANKQIKVEVPKTDSSGFWSRVKIGDKIIKNKNSLKIYITADSERIEFNLGC